MATPVAIVDLLESVVDIFLSDINHRDRAAFVLCDNLVEMACKVKARQVNHQFNMACNFHHALSAPGVNLTTDPLGQRITFSHDTRSSFQHASAAGTVTARTCADAICDAVELINRLWGKTLDTSLNPCYKIALRVVNLYSKKGDEGKRQEFEDAMRKEEWYPYARVDYEDEGYPPEEYEDDDEIRIKIKVNETVIEPGQRRHWMFILKLSPEIVEGVLNACGIP